MSYPQAPVEGALCSPDEPTQAECMAPDDPRHGVNAGYMAGCRGACCKKAHAEYRRGLRARQYIARGPMTIPALGTQRRIRALQAIGWRITDIAEALDLGVHRGVCAPLWQLMNREHTTRNTAERVNALYEQWSMTPGPAFVRNRGMSERKGYLPPLAWDDIDDPAEQPRRGTNHTCKDDVDPVVVDRVLSGDRLHMTTAERREVVIRARGLGWSYLQIEARTGITQPERIVRAVA